MDEKLRKELLDIANELMLEPSEYTMNRIIQEFHIVEQELKALKKIDISSIEPMWTPIPNKYWNNSLRKDEIKNSEFIDTNKIFENAPKHYRDKFFTIKRVVK